MSGVGWWVYRRRVLGEGWVGVQMLGVGMRPQVKENGSRLRVQRFEVGEASNTGLSLTG